MTEIHARLANTAFLYILAVGLWGLWRYFRKQGIDSNYWGSLVIGEGLIIVQGLMGAYLWLINLRPERGGIHILYGVAAALVIPGIFGFTRGDSTRRVSLVYGAALLFLAALLVRAIVTGGV